MAKSKFQKKKEREREVRKKKLARHAGVTAHKKENSKFDAEEKAVRPRQHPIRNEELYAARRMRDLEIKMKLEENMRLLEGLQKEYEEELKKREEYVKTLNDQGVEVSDLESIPEIVPNLAEKATEYLEKKEKEKEEIRGMRSSYVLDAEATLEKK